MLDGQYAFASDSDGTNFAADRRVASLAAAGRIQPALIVAIDNLEDDRFLQYSATITTRRRAACVRGRTASRQRGRTVARLAQFINSLPQG